MLWHGGLRGLWVLSRIRGQGPCSNKLRAAISRGLRSAALPGAGVVPCRVSRALRNCARTLTRRMRATHKPLRPPIRIERAVCQLQLNQSAGQLVELASPQRVPAASLAAV